MQGIVDHKMRSWMSTLDGQAHVMTSEFWEIVDSSECSLETIRCTFHFHGLVYSRVYCRRWRLCVAEVVDDSISKGIAYFHKTQKIQFYAVFHEDGSRAGIWTIEGDMEVFSWYKYEVQILPHCQLWYLLVGSCTIWSWISMMSPQWSPECLTLMILL